MIVGDVSSVKFYKQTKYVIKLILLLNLVLY